MALFYMSANSNTRQLDAQIHFFNLLQWILLVDLSEDNLASNRYVVEKKKVFQWLFQITIDIHPRMYTKIQWSFFKGKLQPGL